MPESDPISWRAPVALALACAALVVCFGGPGGRPLLGAELRAARADAARFAVASAGARRAAAVPPASSRRRPTRPKPRHLGPPPHPDPSAATVPPPPAAAAGPASLPPASAGTNGSYTPPASGKKITPADIAALQRRERLGLAISFNSIALASPSAPERIKRVMAAANEIVGTPYIWGGGHASWHAPGYDCSGAVSYALAGGGFLAAPLTSVGLESWGAPGPGRWLTVYANADHTFAEVDGLRWDTVGDAAGSGPRWHPLPTDTSGFVARHPPGY